MAFVHSIFKLIQKCAESESSSANEFNALVSQAHPWEAYHIAEWQSQEDLNTNALVPKEEPKPTMDDFNFDFPNFNDDGKDALDRDEVVDNDFDLKNYDSQD